MRKIRVKTQNEQEQGIFPEFFSNNRGAYALLAFFGLLAYFQTFYFDFTYFDDNVLILNNFKYISRLSNLLAAFKDDAFYIMHSWTAYYRPLLTVSIILDAQIGGLSPYIYHVTNVAIHIAAACLLYLFLTELKYPKAPALLMSAVFTVHPVLTQAVAWIPGRNDPLTAVFLLSAFITLLRYLGTGKLKYYLLHVLFFALSLFTKETAVFFVAVCLLYYYAVLKKNGFFLKEKNLLIGWAAVLAVWYLMRRAALINPPEQMSFYDLIRVLAWNLPAVIQYAGKIFLPVNLSVMPIMEDTTFVYGLIAAALMTLLLYTSKNKRYPYIVFGIVWFLLFLLPSFIAPNNGIATNFFEHRAYVPMIGLIILMLETDAVRYISAKAGRLTAVGAFLMIIFSLTTFSYSKLFKNRADFWESAVKSSPHSIYAHNNIGLLYLSQGQLDKAEREFRKMLELNAISPRAHYNLGVIYMQRNMLKEAGAEFKEELARYDNYDKANFALGFVCYRAGDLKQAEFYWKKTIQLNPDFTDAYRDLATLYSGTGDKKQASYYTDQLKNRGE